MRPRIGWAVVFLLASPLTLAAQGYRVRLDARAQAVRFRGLQQDSIPVTQVVLGSDGGLFSPDGHAVRCSSATQCYLYRPGDVYRGVPVTSSATVVLWGLGVPGLTVHASGRAVATAGDEDVWPAVDPVAQVIEAYAEYAVSRFTARGGRQFVTSRLEPIGFDGGSLEARWPDAGVGVTLYGGWGLGRAAVVPITSPELNPLDEFRPRDRQILAGGRASWRTDWFDLQAEYRREVDPEDDHFVSERAATAVVLRPWRAIHVDGGLDYNLAEGNLGTADLRVSYLGSGVTFATGARRYRPYFSLWTIWGAFSPVPYNTVHGSARVQVTDWLTVDGRGERYWYEAADVSTALVPDLEDRGWRTQLGATVIPYARWSIEGTYALEFGPGASSRFFDAAVTFDPTPAITLAVYGGRLQRPLELRFYDAKSEWIGGRTEWRIRNGWRVWADMARFDDDRDRPDAGLSGFDQWRLQGGLSVTFGTNADRSPLPPARRTEP